MAPGNNERQPGHTGTIPKTKARNNCNVPQEAVTPTRRDMATNLVSTSLDWVPVSEYNSRGNYNQSRKQTNNTSDHELTDLDNSVTFESGFGRFVPVRPQPRALPLNVQNQNITTDTHDDGAASSASGHSLHPYAHQIQNGLGPHSNHAAAAVMIVNPTTPNAVAGNMSQPFNAPNQNRNNLTRNLNSARNNIDSNAHSSNNNNTTPPVSSSRTATKTVNIMNNMYDQGQGSFNNLNDNNHVHRESARALGEAIVAACPDAAAVERRLGQIREYIRVTSSLVDTMRNSEDEAYIEHTKEEYDELVEMVMKLKESEKKLVIMLAAEKGPDNIEVPAEEPEPATAQTEVEACDAITPDQNIGPEKTCNIRIIKKITNLENEQLNKTLHKVDEPPMSPETNISEQESLPALEELSNIEAENSEVGSEVEIKERESVPQTEESDKGNLNEVLRKNILSCVDKVARIEEMKNRKKNKDSCINQEQTESQDVVVRPVSVQSNGSAYSDNELWQNEIKNKMEISQMRLTALKQQQKRLLKYQEEAKQQLEEMNRERQHQGQDAHPSTSHDNFGHMPNQSYSANYQHSNRMYTANQIGVATTLPHAADGMLAPQNMPNNIDSEHAHSTHSQDERFSHRDVNIASSEEAAGGPRDSDAEEEDEALLGERARLLQMKLRELQLKKQHMESLVTEFQKLQMATNRVGSSRNTYSSSGEDSGVEESTRKFLGNKSGGNIKNEDPFKLMEIKAIKAALQKTKDLMRSVESYEAEHISHVPDDSFQVPNHSNIHENKSEGTGSMGGWSNEGSVCRVRNSLPPRHKYTNEQLHQTQHQQQQMQQQHQQQQMQQQSHEANIATLQELAQELRLETEKIMGERARIKDMVSNNKEVGRKKKVNEEVRGVASGGGAGPAERRQLQLRALLADKQRELEALLNKEKVLCSTSETQKPDSQTASVANQSYTSEQEEPDSRSEQILLDSQNSRENDNFRAGDSGLGARSMNTVSAHLGSAYGSDSDSASRNKSNQRNRTRRRQPHDRQADDINISQQNNSIPNMRHEVRGESSNINMVPPISQNDNPANMPYPPMPQPWNTSKSNQDMRNQFTQNSHSQTMERLLATPQLSYPPSVPFNMMMPYGMVGGCGCGCGFWGAWCWQQILLQQRDIHQLRDQINHLEERWRTETASHTLNNQVPPGNRANNYWDNFRSYSRQNLLSANSKANEAAPAAPQPQPLAERSHNALRREPSPAAPHPPAAAAAAAAAAKRNADPDDGAGRRARRNKAIERSLSFSSAPDVLNLHPEAADEAPPPEPRRADRNLNVAAPIPELLQAHANNLHAPNLKRKSSSKLPAKNSTNRRNLAQQLDYSPTSNIDIAGASEPPNPNLASTSREPRDKATSKLFDLLRENVYSEVTALIGVNESHPDFLIQLFRELQLISSEPLRQRVLLSIRGVLQRAPEDPVSTTDEASPPAPAPGPCTSTVHIDNNIVRFLLMKSEDICTPELLEALAAVILASGATTARSAATRQRLRESLAQYEGLRVCEVSTSIVESLPDVLAGEAAEAAAAGAELQDVAGALCGAGEACPCDGWAPRLHGELEAAGEARAGGADAAVDLISCADVADGDLAEADQTCRDAPPPAPDALPDVVDTDEVTPTEAEAEWLGLDRVPTRLHMEESSENQKD